MVKIEIQKLKACCAFTELMVENKITTELEKDLGEIL